ncbi:MAG: hypothetical protein OXI91_00695 [Chloroflexota bacterium]|nr:hypothetical protein [Chloroflexota bacterium]
MPEDARTLRDAYVRIDQARRDMEILHAEVSLAAKQTVQGMVNGWSDRDNTFHLQLPPADSEAPDRVKLACGRVVEELRSALDYGMMGASKAANPGMNERELRQVSFVIARDKKGFDDTAKRGLAQIDQKLRDFIERLQPYNGNQVLEFISDESSVSKHRNLLQVKPGGSMEVVLREDKARGEWERSDWWVFPAGRGHIYTARIPAIRLVIQDTRDVLEVLPICIDHTEVIIDTLERYLQDGTLIWPFPTN